MAVHYIPLPLTHLESYALQTQSCFFCISVRSQIYKFQAQPNRVNFILRLSFSLKSFSFQSIIFTFSIDSTSITIKLLTFYNFKKILRPSPTQIYQFRTCDTTGNIFKPADKHPPTPVIPYEWYEFITFHTTI